MRKLALIAFDGVVAVDLVLPAETFGRVRLPDGRPGYQVKICGASHWVQTTVGRMEIKHGLAALRHADTIVIPGIDSPERTVDARILEALRRAARRGARIASVCSGAFVLARTGLLKGKRSTTHRMAAEALQSLHPDMEVDAGVLYIDNGQILTSAGGMAQLDLCLHMIRSDYGAAMAAASARLAVMPLERSGGQAQFIVHESPVPEKGESLADLLDWVRGHLTADLSVEALAHRAAMSGRTFVRRFQEQTGMTPAKWVVSVRIGRAQTLLETTSVSIEKVAEAVGFASTAAFRMRFRETAGVAAMEYRRTFRRESSKHSRHG